MTKEWIEGFWKSLEQDLRTITEEVVLENPKEDCYLLSSMFTTVKGGKGVALFEAQMYDYGVQGNVLEIVVTPREYSVKESAMPELEKAVARINYFTPLGAFGVHAPTKQLFLRYVVPLDETEEVGKSVKNVRKTYEILGGVFGNVYSALKAVGTGESSYDKEVEAGNIPKQ